MVTPTLPGQPIPAPDHSLGENFFPNIQPESPLAQLEAIPSSPVACFMGEEADPHLAKTPFQVVVESNEVTPQPSLLQAK